MVVLSGAVLTKQGRTLFARQFVDMNRLRIEGLLAAFPKLFGTGSKQHTFIETDTVRYVYQPLEGLFLLLITTKASNIVEDLDTLRLLSKVVPEFAGGTSEEKVSEKAFELVFAFDEVIATGGYREYVDLRQIRQNLEMDSHEEKLHNMVKKTKMDSAKDQANHMSKVIKSRQRDAAKGLGGVGGMAGIGGGDSTISEDSSEMAMPAAPTLRQEPEQPAVQRPPPMQVKSLKLGKKPKSSSLMESMASEEGISLALPTASKKKAAPAAETIAPASSSPIAIVVEEKITCAMTREGALEQFDLKGTLTVTANSAEAAAAKVLVGEAKTLPGLTFQCHPKVDKRTWESDKTLQLKDAKGFPVGRSVAVVRWSLQSADETIVPLAINCWPEDEGDQINVNIEYTLQRTNFELHNVEILVPLGTNSPPHILAVDGSHSHSGEHLTWSLPMIDHSNATGTLEFNIASDDPDAFFPIQVNFQAKSLYWDVNVDAVKSTSDDEANVQYSMAKALNVESFKIA